MTRHMHILFDRAAGDSVARIMLDSPLPKGAVLHLPMVGGGGRDVNYILKTGVWRVVSDPEIAVVPGYGASAIKMLVEEIGSIIPPESKGAVERWLPEFESETPFIYDDVP